VWFNSDSAATPLVRFEQFSVFESVQEITGALIVERHGNDFRNLSFFRNLRIIHGRELGLVELLLGDGLEVLERFVKGHTHTHTHPFNGLFSGTTWVGPYQKVKTNLDFTEASDSEWKWYQLGRMQVCTSLQTDNHHSVFYRPDALPAAQSTASKH